MNHMTQVKEILIVSRLIKVAQACVQHYTLQANDDNSGWCKPDYINDKCFTMCLRNDPAHEADPDLVTSRVVRAAALEGILLLANVLWSTSHHQSNTWCEYLACHLTCKYKNTYLFKQLLSILFCIHQVNSTW